MHTSARIPVTVSPVPFDRARGRLATSPECAPLPLPFDHTVCPGRAGARFRALRYACHQALAFIRRIVEAPWTPSSYARLLDPWGLVELIPDAVYRSAEPRAPHFHRLKAMGIRTLVCVKRTLPRARTIAHATARGLHVARIDLGPDGNIGPRAVQRALDVVTQPWLWPLLLHCDGGRHRTGVVAAALRKTQGWTMEAALEEYERCAAPAPRQSDRDAIERCFRGTG
jgi:hypothetical protein